MDENIGHQQHEIEDRVDHISNLPDCILHHILSYVPTKEVVKTSVLSPRWKNLWVSVPNLDVDVREIDEWNPPKLTSFKNFLEQVLHSRGESNIKKFHLTCSGKNEEFLVHLWILDAITHHLQELYLTICRGPCPFTIPWAILDSTSLVSLKITADDFGELPSGFSLPCLKTLHLEHLVLVTDDQVEKLLLSFPVLEELVLSDIWMTLSNIEISNSALKSLKIRDMQMFDDPTCVCKIKIDAENLASFEYRGYLSNEVLLSNVSSLVKVFIDLTPPPHPVWESLVEGRAAKLLERLIDLHRETKARKKLENIKMPSMSCTVKYA